MVNTSTSESIHYRHCQRAQRSSLHHGHTTGSVQRTPSTTARVVTTEVWFNRHDTGTPSVDPSMARSRPESSAGPSRGFSDKPNWLNGSDFGQKPKPGLPKNEPLSWRSADVDLISWLMCVSKGSLLHKSHGANGLPVQGRHGVVEERVGRRWPPRLRHLSRLKRSDSTWARLRVAIVPRLRQNTGRWRFRSP